MDLRNFGIPFENKFLEFSKDEIRKITNTFHSWRKPCEESDYKDVPEFCRSVKKAEIVAKNYSLAPSSYIVFEDKDQMVDFSVNIKLIAKELQVLLEEEKKSNAGLCNVLREFGYELDL